MTEIAIPNARRIAALPFRFAGSRLSWIFSRLLLWQQRAEERAQLAAMDQRMLKDIGVSRADVAREASKAPWQA